MAKHASDEREGKRGLPFTRFDFYLLFIFALIVFVVTTNYLLVMSEHEQFSPSFFDFAGRVVGGEIVLFSLYQIAKKVTGAVPRRARKESELIDDVESDEEQEETNG